MSPRYPPGLDMDESFEQCALVGRGGVDDWKAARIPPPALQRRTHPAQGVMATVVNPIEVQTGKP